MTAAPPARQPASSRFHPERSEGTLSLPAGWTTGPIENLFAPLADGRTLHQGWSPQCEKEPSPAEDVWGVLKTTSIQAGEFQPEHNKRLPDKLEPRPLIEVEEGDILITCAGPRARCGVACLVRRTRKRLMMSGKMYRFRVDPKRHDARYVEAFLQSEQARQAIDKMKTGGSDSGLNLTHDRFRQLPVPVAPLPEQRRIVAEIEKQFTRLEAGVAALRRVQANLHRYRAAVLKAACEGRLVPTEAATRKTFETGAQLLQRILKQRRDQWTGKGKYKEPAPIEPGELPALPEGWTFASAEAVCASVRDGTHETPGYVTDGVPLITSKNLLPSGLDFENTKLISKSDYARFEERSGVERGDILFAMIGTVGNPVVVNTDRPFSIKNVGLFKRNEQFVSSRYLKFWMESPQFEKWLTPKLKGTNQKFAPLNLLRGLAVALPPVAEQERIVAEVERRLSVVEELSALVTANLQRATRLRQSILQKAFEGKLICQT